MCGNAFDSFNFWDPAGNTGDPRETPAEPPAEASQEEKDYYKAMTDILNREPTKLEQMMEDFGEQSLQQMIDDMPMNQEMKQMAYDWAKQQQQEMQDPDGEYQKRKELNLSLMNMQLEGIEEARALGDITGDLSDQEMEALNTMETNAIDTMTKTVMHETEKVMGGVVSQMVDRGVLQGSVGAQTMADVGKRATELIAQGSQAIASQKAGNILQMGEAQKQRQMQTKQMLQSGVLAGQGMGNQWTGQAMGYVGGQSNLAQQMQQTGQQYSAGMALQGEQMRAGLGSQMWGTMYGGRQAGADRALAAQIAMTQAEAQKYSARFGAYGSVASAGASKSSRKAKKDIVEVSDKHEGSLLEATKGLKIYTYRYKTEEPDSKKHLGIVTEEAPSDVVTKDGESLDIVSYFGYLTACVKQLVHKIELLEQKV